RGRWPAWKRACRRLQDAYARKAGGDPVAGRLAGHFAALTVCAHLAQRALRLPWKWRNPVKELWEELLSQATEADKAAAALRGWLLTDRSSGKARHRCRVGSVNAWLIAIDRAAIEQVEGPEPEPAPTPRGRAVLREQERTLDEAITTSGIGPQVLDWAARQQG